MNRLFKGAIGAFFFAGSLVPATGSFAQTDTLAQDMLGATSPIPALSCLYVSEWNGSAFVNRSRCSGWAAWLGAVPLNGNAGTPSALTLTNATGLPISTGVSGLGAGVGTLLTTPSSANLFSALTTKTGTGLAVFATSPTLVAPNLGQPTTLDLLNATNLPIASTTGNLAFGRLSLTGTPTGSKFVRDDGVLAIPAGSSSSVGATGNIQISSDGAGGLGSFAPGVGVTTFLTTPSSTNFRTILNSVTGTGAAVFATSPTLITPALGTPASGVATNLTGLPVGGIASIAANSLIGNPTGSGAIPTTIAIPACADTGGNHLNYSGGALSCGTTGDGVGGGTINLTDTVTPLSGVTALTVDHTAFTVGGTAGAATLGPLCPAAATTLGDANGAISVGKIARINATLTAARSYSMPAIASYPVGCQLTIVDSNRTVSASNTATITRNADAATLNTGTTYPAITTGGFFTVWESDGTNWSLVGNGTVATLQAGQIYFGNASNQTTAGVPTGDVIPNSSNAWTIQASANVVKAPSNLTNNVLTKGDGTKNISASAITDGGAGVTFGSPTGGAQGANTLNTAGGIFINGVAVGTSGGNVTNSGTPLVNQMGLWVDATHIKGNVNLTDDGTTLTALQAFALSGTIAPTALSSTTSDYAPTGIATSSRIEIDPANGGNALTGITTGFAGRRLTIYNSNAASGVLTISNNVTSSAGNRFFLPGSNDISLKPKGSRTFIWSTSANGWTLEGAALESIVTAGSCTNCNVTYGVDGRATTYANGTSGNVSNSGSPTVGQAALWVDATHIQGVTAPTMYMGFSLSPVASTTRFTSPFAANSLTGEIFTIMPRAGTIKSIAVADSADIGNANTITFTVRVNGVDSALVCILSGTGSGFDVNTCTGSVAYAANDRISVKLVTTTLTGTGQVSGNLEYLPS